MLEKHQTVMKKTDELITYKSTSVSFANDRGEQLELHPQLWEEMIRPTEITVTVEPGDCLNG